MTGRAGPAGVLLALAGGLAAGALVAGCGGSSKNGRTATTVTALTTRTVVVTGATPSTTATPSSTTPSSTANGTAAQPGGTVPEPALVRPFAANSPWNTPIDTLPVDANSARYMRLASERVGLNAAADASRSRFIDAPLFINTDRWTVPVVSEQGGVPTRVVCRQPPLLPPDHDYCGDGWSVTRLTVPAGTDPHPEYDGWFTVLNRRQRVGYDLWRARRSTADGQTISYQFMRKWNLDGPGFLQPGNVSARGSGLPLFAGLVVPEEIQAGRIDHALAISVPAPAQRNYVPPASTTDGIGRLTSLPEGARIRLKQGVTLQSTVGRYDDPRCEDPLFGLRSGTRTRRCHRYRFPALTNRRAAQALYATLRRYGAIVVDRSRVPTLYATFDPVWARDQRDARGRLLDPNGQPFADGQRHNGTPLLRGDELAGLRLSDFEVVRLPGLLKAPSLPNVRVPPGGVGVTGQAVQQPRRPARRNGRPRSTVRQNFQPGGGGG